MTLSKCKEACRSSSMARCSAASVRVSIRRSTTCKSRKRGSPPSNAEASRMSKKPSIEPYTSPAGGWGASLATFEHLQEQGILLKGSKELWHMNKPGGFDCPGCGWPDPSPSSAEPLVFCENGAKALAWEMTERRVTPEFFAKHTVSWLRAQSDYWLEQQGRLTHPMVYNSDTDHYDAVTWEDAFAGIARILNGLASPNEADFYTSGRSSNEAAFLYQLFAREFGTNNF